MKREPGNIAILGSTGTIGLSGLDVVRRNPDKFNVVSLSANQNVSLLQEQIEEFKPLLVSVSDQKSGEDLQGAIGKNGPKIVVGPNSAELAVSEPSVHTVLMAISGYAALKPLLTAIENDVHIALANKESMVAAGDLVNARLLKSKSSLIPVDSEHSSLYQLLLGVDPREVRSMTITASGGPFWNLDAEQMKEVTPEQAIKHPNWEMGAKISVDSATMINKGLEVIEAVQIFQLPEDKVKVLVHPQSILHGMIDFEDGTQTAVLYQTDMRIPIAHALSKLASRDPKESPGLRVENSGVAALDLANVQDLSFFQPDNDRFPGLELCRKASRIGGLAPCILNAANEIAVSRFLNKEIGFTEIVDIARIVGKDLENLVSGSGDVLGLAEIENADAAARKAASECVL